MTSNADEKGTVMAETTSKATTCPVCDTTDPGWSWTDTHGIAQCCGCGLPFKLFHYDEKNVRVDLPPECIVTEAWLPLLRRFREETGCIIPGGCSFPGGQELATEADARAFNAWCAKNADEIAALNGGASS